MEIHDYYHFRLIHFSDEVPYSGMELYQKKLIYRMSLKYDNITVEHILKEFNELLLEAINDAEILMPVEESVNHLLDSCALDTLTQLCDCTVVRAYFIGELVKNYVKLQKYNPHGTPKKLQCHIVGHQPLNQLLKPYQIDMFKKYLGSKSQNDVNLLINCLFDFVKQLNNNCNVDTLEEIYNSPWYYLLLTRV